MDPDHNLAEQLRISNEITAITDTADDGLTEDQELNLIELAEDLATLVIALNGWITNSGFIPQKWSKKV
jgi:hypothetical protein